MEVVVECVERLRFEDGSPVRAASAVAAFGDGHLVVQDDATHGAWLRAGTATAVRLLPDVEGVEVFDEASGTKHLKPDFEAAVGVTVNGDPAVLVLGSGSSPARMRWSVARLERGRPRVQVGDLTAVYAAVAAALCVEAEALNMEGACLVGDALRWFYRGLPASGLAPGSVDLDAAAAVAAALGRADPATVPVTNPGRYRLGDVHGVGLAITDAVALTDGSVLLSAAAEDSPNARDDGPVVGSALVHLDGAHVRSVTALPSVGDQVVKVEGLALLDDGDDGLQLLAVVDVDDPATPSLSMHLRLRY